MDIKKIAYKLYLEDWKINNISDKDKLFFLKEYLKFNINETYEEWLRNDGIFRAKSFEEFYDNEYCDDSYMAYLFNDDIELLNLYYSDFL